MVAQQNTKNHGFLLDVLFCSEMSLKTAEVLVEICVVVVFTKEHILQIRDSTFIMQIIGKHTKRPIRGKHHQFS